MGNHPIIVCNLFVFNLMMLLLLLRAFDHFLVINQQFQVRRPNRQILPLAIDVLQRLEQLPPELLHQVQQHKRYRPRMSSLRNN